MQVNSPILYHHVMGAGTPVLILHGLLGSSDNWISLARLWSSDCRVVLVDLRNHGRSFHHDSMDYPAMANDLRQLITHLDLNKFHIVGHSMGGKLLMELLKHPMPGLLRSMVVDITPRAYPGAHDHILHAMDDLPLSNTNSRTMLDELLSDTVQDSRVRQFVLKNVVRNAEGQFVWRVHLDSIRQNYAHIAGPIVFQHPVNHETWFVRGDHSDYITDADVNELKAVFVNMKIITLQNAGHWVHADQPEAFSKLVIQLIQ